MIDALLEIYRMEREIFGMPRLERADMIERQLCRPLPIEERRELMAEYYELVTFPGFEAERIAAEASWDAILTIAERAVV